MRVVVVGCGRVGSELATILSRDGNEVSVIDKRPEALHRLAMDWGGKGVVGFGFDRDALEEAGIAEADALAAVTNGDNSNILTARIARETYEVPRVVARIYDPRRAVIYRRLGIPTVATVTWTVDQVMRRLLPERATPDWVSPTGDVVMVERALPPSWVGYGLEDLEVNGRLRIVALSRAGKSHLPKPGVVGQAGDVLYVTVLEGSLDALDEHLGRGPRRMKVVIAGAGNVGSYLAADLRKAGHEVLLIEQDPEVAERGANLGVEWMVRDACEVSALDAAGLANTDVVVAATGDDEDNLVISLLAKQEFAVPRVVARVNHPKNHWLFNQTWGVDIAVSTPHLLASLVEEAVSVGSLVRIMQLESSGAHLVEVTLAPGSPAAGKELARLGMPREATVVAVVRRAHVVVPRGDTVLEPGDEVLVLASPDSEDAVRSLLVAEAKPPATSLIAMLSDAATGTTPGT